MKIQIKRVLPALLVIGLSSGISSTSVFALEHGAGAEIVTVHPAADIHTDEGEVGTHPPIEAAHGDAAAHGEGHGDSHAAPMITAAKVWDLLWRALNFAGLVFLLVKFGGKPMVDFLGGRRKEIKDDLSTLQDRRDAAEQSYQEFTARLAGVEDEIELIVSRAVALAGEEKTRILAEAENAAQEIRRQAEAAVQAAAAEVQKRLQSEAVEQAAAMAEELIAKNLTPEDQVILIEQYLEKTGSVQ